MSQKENTITFFAEKIHVHPWPLNSLGWSKSTKYGSPWIIKYVEQFKTKSAALKREREIKNKKSRKYIEWLITK